MTDSYYLINDHTKFHFEIENLRIEFEGRQEFLEPKEARILKYVLEKHVDGLIKSEAILDDNWDYWSDKKVLQKVLSTLRKKFKRIGVTENGFFAADASYKINYRGVLVNEAEQADKVKRQYKDKILRYLKTVVPMIITVVVAFVAYVKLNEGPRFTVGNIIQSTTLDGISLQPDLSPDGRAMAFSHQKQGFGQIYLKIDAILNLVVLTEGHFDQVPSWSPSGRQLAYQRKRQDKCEIRLIKLDADYQKVGEDKVIYHCNQLTDLMSLSFKDENTLFFTEATRINGPAQINRLDLNSLKVTAYLSESSAMSSVSNSGSGQYFIVYNQDLGSLYSLQSPDSKVFHINKVNENNTVTRLREMRDKILSFDIFDNHVIFKDLDNELKSFDIDDPKDLTTIYKNPLKTISYPVVSANNNKIAIVSGSAYKNSLFTLSLADNQISQLMSAQTLVKHPQELDQEVFFMSDEAGIFQIYSYSNALKTQLTNFSNNKKIVYFSLSNDRKWLAVSFLDSTTIYERHVGGITEVKSFAVASYPSFSKNSERILLSNLIGTGTQEQSLIEYYVDGFKETGISIRNAAYGMYHDSGIIFPAADNSIKLFKLNGVDTIIENLKVGSRGLIAVNDTDMFISSDEVSQVIKVNLKTRAREVLAAPIHGQISANNDHLLFKRREPGSMVIFKGELNAL
jgi:Tol biopolymer transport system component